MTPTRGEDNFQEWVQARIEAVGGHYEDHRYSNGVGVPDLSAAYGGKDYWLELKYGEFKLLHSGYDDFAFSTMQRRQLDWLVKRSIHGNTTCGILGYFLVTGDHKVGPGTPYIFFMAAQDYLRHIWQKKFSTGAIILSPCCEAADCIKTGRDLLRFINGASVRPLRNE